MRVQYKIFSLLALVTGVFVVAFVGMRSAQFHDIEQLRELHLAEQQRQLEQSAQAAGLPLQHFTADFARSDDLVHVVEARAPAWARATLPQALARYHALAAYVYTREFDPVLAVSPDAGGTPIDSSVLRALAATTRHMHFFVADAAGVIELHGAPITPARDSLDTEDPRGYLLVSRRWDAALLASLAPAQARITLLDVMAAQSEPPSAAAPASGARVYLPGPDGKPVALLTATGTADAMGEWRLAFLQGTLFMVFFAVVLATVAYVLMRRWVSRPLAIIAEALAADNPRLTRELDGSPSEFGQISRFIRIFHGQRADLVSQISARRQLESQLRHIASHDALTDLPNRALFQERLDHALALATRQGTRLAVLLIDLDRFKNVNDTLGHPVGDRLLKVMAARIAGRLRPCDLLARPGGDEFLVCMEEIRYAGEIAHAAMAILETVAEPVQIDERELIVTCSIGIGVCPEDGADADTLIKHADGALYRAKDQGRNAFQFFDQTLRDETAHRLSLESHLRRALEREELSLVYQPRMDLATGRIHAVETLIRWQHPQLGLIAPEHFISLAEETGLIVPIANWMMRAASAQALAWQNSGLPPLRVAVNISARQFRQDSVSTDVIAAVTEAGLEPRWLELELTEGLLVHSFETTSRHILRLRELGIGFAIDDFGVGYSALGYLRRLPIDAIKIDRSFVQDLTLDSDNMALVDGIIRLAHGLRLRVIAEGVETLAQAEILRLQECDEIQGYHVSRPLPAAEVAHLLEVEREVRNVRTIDHVG